MKKAAALLLCLIGGEALASLHPPQDYKGSIEEKSHQAILFFDGSRQELVLKIAYRAADPLKSMAWVVPVPSAPDEYQVESHAVFEELFRKFEEGQAMPRGGRSPNNDGPLEFLAKAGAGEYEIQPIRGRGPEAAAELNRWLAKHGYGEIGEENLKHYLERKWTFLAIRIAPEKGKDSLDPQGALRPLRISFSADRIYYPLKLSSGMGSFNVTLYVVTPKGLPQTERGFPPKELSDRLQRFGFTGGFLATPVEAGDRRHPALAELWNRILSEKRLKFRKGVLNKLMAYGVNGTGRKLSEWEEDFSIESK